GWRRGHVIGISRESISCELAVNLRAALFRVFELFHHDNAGAFAHDKTVAVAVERPGSAFGLIIARAESFHGRKSRQTNRDNRSLRTAGKENIGVAEFDYPPGFSNRVI